MVFLYPRVNISKLHCGSVLSWLPALILVARNVDGSKKCVYNFLIALPAKLLRCTVFEMMLFHLGYRTCSSQISVAGPSNSRNTIGQHCRAKWGSGVDIKTTLLQ